MTFLHEIAPRLARARDAWVATERTRVRLETKRLQADRLLAHRELQDVRAANTGNRKYIRHRRRKLEAARAKREQLG